MTNDPIKAAPCPVCGNMLSVEAAACPKCGHPITPSTKDAMIQGEQERRAGRAREAEERKERTARETAERERQLERIRAARQKHEAHRGWPEAYKDCEYCQDEVRSKARWEYLNDTRRHSGPKG
jgi:hypothetical protein